MKYYQITITSKNRESLKDYSKFLNNNIEIFNIFNKSYNKIKKKKVITILKSPHVNKKAQEQFEYLTFSKKITLQIENSYTFLILLKKMEMNLFSDIKIKLKLLLNKNLLGKYKKKPFNPIYFKLNFFENLNLTNNIKTKKTPVNFRKITKMFQILDISGEICCKSFNLTTV